VPVRKRLFALSLAAFALSGCAGSGGDDESRSAQLDLADLVLQPEDVPRGFQRFDEGRLNLVDFRPGPRQGQTRFGREDGWKARFRRRGTPATRGPLVINSQVDLFADVKGATEDLEAYKKELAAPWSRLPAPALGDAAIAVTLLQGSGRFGQRHITVAWRNRNTSASVAVQGFEGKVSVDDALALARRQQRRLEES
jgi:hypothetical protein